MKPEVRFGLKATFEEGPVLADSVAKVFLSLALLVSSLPLSLTIIFGFRCKRF